jgi:hypothetical protein
MNPIRGSVMLNFLNWVTQSHPEISSLSNLPEDNLFILINEFESGKLNGNPDLQEKWRRGFYEMLLGDTTDRTGYGLARKKLFEIEQK